MTNRSGSGSVGARLALTACLACALGCGSAPPVIEAPRVPVPPSFLREDAPAATPVTLPAVPDALGAVLFDSVHREDLIAVAESADGALVATAGAEGTVAVYDTRAGATRFARRIWVYSDGTSKFLSFSPAGPLLLVATDQGDRNDGEVLVWDLRSDTLVSLTRASEIFGQAAQWSPQGDSVAYLAWAQSAGGQRVQHVRIWSVPEARVVLDVPAPDGEMVTHLAFSVSGDTLAFVDEHGTLRLVDVRGGNVRAAVEPPAHDTEGGEAAEVEEEASEESSEEQEQGDDYNAYGNSGAVEPTYYWRDLVYRPTGGAIVLIRDDGLFRVMAPRTAQVITELQLEPRGEEDVWWSPDGAAFALAWADGEPVRTYDGATGAPREETWSPEAMTALFPDPHARADGVDLVLQRDGDERRVSHGVGEHSLWGVQFLPSGRGVITRGRGGVELWRPDVVRSVSCVNGELAVAFVDETHVTQEGDGACNLLTDEGQAGSGNGYYEEESSGEEEEEDGEDGVEAEDLYCPEPGHGERCVRGDARGLEVVGRDAGAEDAPRPRRLARTTGTRVDSSVRFSPSGAFFALRVGTSLRLVDLARGRVVATVPSADEVAAWAPDERSCVVAIEGAAGDAPTTAALALVDTRTGRVRGRYALTGPEQARAPQSLFSYGAGATAAIVALDGLRFVTVATGAEGAPIATGGQSDLTWLDADTVLVRTSRGAVPVSVQTGLGAAYELPEGAVAHAAGDVLAVCAAAGLLRVHDARTGAVRGETRLEGCAVASGVTLSGDGRFALVGGIVSATVVRTADLAQLALHVLRTEDGPVPVAFSASGAFQADPAHLPHLAVRRPGQAATAELLAGEAARAWLRPTLVADFFEGRPLL